jgi:hypothetical protein
MADLISPDGLEADAVVPQCLDNQYVSDEVFHDMVRRRADYRDERVAAARERDFRTEFVRSLIYSSQVVIQRAFLRNSDFLYKNYHPENGENLRAFADLVRQRAIVPYLLYESSLDEDFEFDVRKDGDLAMRALLGEVGDDVRCVRLAIGADANSQAAAAMGTEFGVGLTRLNNLDSRQRNALAAELFADPGRLHEEGAWQAFENAVDDLAEYSFRKARERRRENRPITRQDVYRDHFVGGGGADGVAIGRFKAPDRDNPFLLELKKYVDLVYNVNLPDRLKRYTFTPANMPSRMALQDAPQRGFEHEDIRALVSDPEMLEAVRRSFMARTQSAMDLPLLSELSIADVVAIRRLPEWESFKRSQLQILKNPLQCLDNMAAFQDSFDDFQRALSEWYNRTYRRRNTIQRYCSFVSLTLSIGGVFIVAGSHLGPLQNAVADVALSGLAARIPQTAKGYAAKLMVGVYDLERRRLDADRAYTIELMQTNAELMRDDVHELLNAVTRSRDAAVPGAAGLIADQGIR